jgi:hypothetical protein
MSHQLGGSTCLLIRGKLQLDGDWPQALPGAFLLTVPLQHSAGTQAVTTENRISCVALDARVAGMPILWGIFLRRAARKYATNLGPQLLKGYGASRFYTPGQIRAAAQRRKLPSRYLKIGYAAFLDLDGFLSVVSDASPSDYEALRALYERYKPSNVWDTFAPALIDVGGGAGYGGGGADSAGSSDS